MKKFGLGLWLGASLCSASLAATETAYRDDSIIDASLPLEVIRMDTRITVDDFVRANKEMPVDDTISMCRIIGNNGYISSVESELDRLLEKNKIQKIYFVERGYSNLKCFGKNLLVFAMHDDSATFMSFIKYGLNFNRPVQFDNLVGTPLDFAKHEFEKTKAQGKNPGPWFTNMRIIKENGGKSCKELQLKCSIDYQ